MVGHLRTYGATLSVLHSESLTLFVQKGKRQKLGDLGTSCARNGYGALRRMTQPNSLNANILCVTISSMQSIFDRHKGQSSIEFRQKEVSYHDVRKQHTKNEKGG